MLKLTPSIVDAQGSLSGDRSTSSGAVFSVVLHP